MLSFLSLELMKNGGVQGGANDFEGDFCQEEVRWAQMQAAAQGVPAQQLAQELHSARTAQEQQWQVFFLTSFSLSNRISEHWKPLHWYDKLEGHRKGVHHAHPAMQNWNSSHRRKPGYGNLINLLGGSLQV